MDILKMASQIASSMSDSDKSSLENMDMEQVLSHVTKNVFKMMNTMNSGNQDLDSESGIQNIIGNIIPGNIQENIPVSTQLPDRNSGGTIVQPRTRDILFDLNVDLEDLYNGKKKKLNVKRKKVVEINGKQVVIEEKKKLIVVIEKGMKDEQLIKFEGEADQLPGYKPGDIIITLIENEHPEYERDGDNLIIIKNINLYQIYDLTFGIKHLDSRILQITKETNDGLHLNDSMRKVTGEGMPIYKGNGNYGDLFIRFNIVIPSSIDSSKLKLLKQLFNDPIEPESNLNTITTTFDKSYILENVSEIELENLITYSGSESESDSDSDSTDSVLLDSIKNELSKIQDSDSDLESDSGSD